MKFNLKRIGHFFTVNNLWHKTFNEFSQQEIESMCKAIALHVKRDKERKGLCPVCGKSEFWKFENWRDLICANCFEPPYESSKITFENVMKRKK